MRTIIIASVALAGCACGYGGPGCDDPVVVGLCAPIVEVGKVVAIEIDYGDDTGLHPDGVRLTRVSDPHTLGVTPGATTGTLTVQGLAAGYAEVELHVDGWDRSRVVGFQVTTDPAPPCTDPSVEPASFSLR